MTKVAFSITSVPPFRDVVGRFVDARENLLRDKRDFMRFEGRRMRDLAQDEAPKGKTGRFAKGIRFKTFQGGDTVGFNVTTPQPLGRYILEGTKPHIIRARGRALVFPWPSGPPSLSRDGLFFFASVHHPGTKPNPFMSRAYRRWLPGARKGLNQVSRNYIRFIMGAKTPTVRI